MNSLFSPAAVVVVAFVVVFVLFVELVLIFFW
jgi:hypothetical protein